jgi:hypothetical protein
VASYYIYSGAGGAANGTSWADAYTTLTTAFSGKSSGDIFYVAHDHSESTAGGLTFTGPDKIRVLCVNRAGSVPPVAADLTTGALVVSTGGGIVFNNYHSHHTGIAFHCASAMQFLVSTVTENCALKLTGGSTRFYGHDNTPLEWRNTTVEFTDASQYVRPAHQFRWLNTPSAVSGTVPTTLFQSSPNGVNIHIEGVDLSAVTSGNTIMAQSDSGHIVFKDCKVAAGVTLSPVFNDPYRSTVEFVRCDSTGNYRHERYDRFGTQTTETTIVRTGGASDGTTPISWKLVTGSFVVPWYPMESMPISVWNDTTGGTKTVTVEGVWGGGAVPDNDDIWIEVEYLGDASSPQGSLATSRKTNILSTAAGYATSSETWGGSTTKFKMSATTGTIQQKGPLTVRVYAALASSTFYVCPKVTVA